MAQVKPHVANKELLLAVLLSILAFNFADRIALGLLLQDIKLDLQLNDSQLGFLSGIAFALFYAVMGIPIARWADRGNRVRIISLTTALGSAAVALCGMAGTFVQLLTIRVGVAVGEAGCIPTAHSLIADHFSRAERPRAVGIYMLGGSVSVVIGYGLAGWIDQLYGWRATFVWIGLPGLVLAVLSALTLKDPRSSQPVPQAESPTPVPLPPQMREVFSALWSNATFRHLLLCFSVTFFFGAGIGQWQPAFFIRTHGLHTGELGTWLAVINGVGGMLGTYWGGALASRYAPNDEGLQLKGLAAVYAGFAVISACIYLSPNHYMAFGLMAFAAVGSAATAGPLFATIQTVVPEQMRAMSIALVYLAANLVGMGLGPLAVGVLSDALQPSLGADSLRYALLALCPGYFWAAWHFLRASRTVMRDLQGTPI